MDVVNTQHLLSCWVADKLPFYWRKGELIFFFLLLFLVLEEENIFAVEGVHGTEGREEFGPVSPKWSSSLTPVVSVQSPLLEMEHFSGKIKKKAIEVGKSLCPLREL